MTCIFCQIAQGEITPPLLYEDDEILAFADIKPQAPTHCLIIPKEHIPTINDANDTHQALLGKMVLAGQRLADELGLADDGYRLVFNCNSQGGQEVFHIHLHLLGGRQMTWPPG